MRQTACAWRFLGGMIGGGTLWEGAPMSVIRRREFVALLGGAGLLCAAKARRARAQQPGMPVVGFLRDSTAAGSEFMVNGLRKGRLGRRSESHRRVCLDRRPERAVIGARGRIGGPARARHR